MSQFNTGSLGAGAVGSLTGIATAILLQPLDVLRTRQQQPQTNFRTIRAAIANVVKTGGIRDVWRGTTPAVLRWGSGGGVYFASLTYLISKYPYWAKLVGATGAVEAPPSSTFNGAASGCCRALAVFTACPFTVLKTRMESSVSYIGRPTMSQLVLTMAKREGLRGFYSGLLMSLARDVPFATLYFVVYQTLRDGLLIPDKNNQYSVGGNFGCAGTAAVMASIITHPADVTRTRLQLSIPTKGTPRTATVQLVKELCYNEGASSLWRGLCPRLLRRGLSSAITWTAFEELSKRLLST